MKKYLTTLIEEKGRSTEEEIQLDGHFGLTYEMLIDFVDSVPEYHKKIKSKIVQIDFKNGDVFHYLDFLAKGMVQSLGY